MSYTSVALFENAVNVLLECYKHMDEQLPESEEQAKHKLIRLCKQIDEEYGKSK